MHAGCSLKVFCNQNTNHYTYWYNPTFARRKKIESLLLFFKYTIYTYNV